MAILCKGQAPNCSSIFISTLPGPNVVADVSCDEWSGGTAPYISGYMCGIDGSQHTSYPHASNCSSIFVSTLPGPNFSDVSCDEWSGGTAPYISGYMCGIDGSQHTSYPHASNCSSIFVSTLPGPNVVADPRLAWLRVPPCGEVRGLGLGLGLTLILWRWD